MTLTTQDQSAAAELRIRRHRSRLLMQHPWYGSIGCELELEMDPTCQTAWTNGKAIGFNPDFAMGLPSKHLSGVIAHEILHVAMRHNYRRGNRDQGMWNIACDHAINGVLIADGFELPADALLEDRYKGMSSESIYAAMVTEQQQEQQEAGDDAGDDSSDGDSQSDDDSNGDNGDNGDSKSDGDDSSDGEQQDGNGEQGDESGQGDQAGEANEDGAASDDQQQMAPGEVRDAVSDAPAEEDWKTKVVQAAKLAQNIAAAGDTDAAAMDRAVADAKQAQVNWKDMLQQFLTQTVREDFDWSRASRRHLHTDIHMPSMSSEGAGTIAVAIDTSGSIDQKALDVFIGELQGVVDQVNPERVLVWCIDTQIRNEQTFERGDLIQPKIKGGGGTRFEPAFKAAAESVEDIACLIYFTDGYAMMPKEVPSTPTLWAITTPQQQHERDAKAAWYCQMPTFGDIAYLEAN